MKLKITILNIFILFVISCQNSEKNISKMNLKGDITKITEIKIDNNNDTIKKTILKFNRNNFIEEMQVYLQNSFFQKIKYKYNYKNQLTEEKYFNNQNQFFLKILYTYSSNEVRVKSFDKSNNFVGDIIAFYNSEKQVKKEVGWFFYDDSLYYEANYFYKNNILQEKNLTNSDSLLNNFKIMYIGNISGEPEKILYLNKNNDTIDSYSFSYDFDDYGNWTTKTEYCNNTQTNITYRIIEYL